jgi:predicted Zn-dependent protease
MDENTQQQATNPLTRTPRLIVRQVEATATHHYQHGRFDRAREKAEALVEMRPERADYWTLLGVTYRQLDKRAAALFCLKRAAEIDPEDPNTLVNLGEALCEVGRAREGVALLRGIFDEGYDPALPPAQQDEFTRRAGAQLALIRDAASGFRKSLEAQS